MRKGLTAIGIVGVLVFSATPAFADRGAPGSTFPEQGVRTTDSACNAILTNPAPVPSPEAGVAASITSGLLAEACFGF